MNVQKLQVSGHHIICLLLSQLNGDWFKNKTFWFMKILYYHLQVNINLHYSTAMKTGIFFFLVSSEDPVLWPSLTWTRHKIVCKLFVYDKNTW